MPGAIDNGCTGTVHVGGGSTSLRRRWRAANEPVLGPVVNGGTIPNTTQGVRVTVDRPSPTQFMKLIGIDEVAVQTHATSLTAKLPTLPAGRAPSGGDEPANEHGARGCLQHHRWNWTVPGNFGWLFVDAGANAANILLEQRPAIRTHPEITVPLYVPGNPGKKKRADLRDCLNDYIDNGTTFLIPIWDGTHPEEWEQRAVPDHRLRCDAPDAHLAARRSTTSRGAFIEF